MRNLTISSFGYIIRNPFEEASYQRRLYSSLCCRSLSTHMHGSTALYIYIYIFISATAILFIKYNPSCRPGASCQEGLSGRLHGLVRVPSSCQEGLLDGSKSLNSNTYIYICMCVCYIHTGIYIYIYVYIYICSLFTIPYLPHNDFSCRSSYSHHVTVICLTGSMHNQKKTYKYFVLPLSG